MLLFDNIRNILITIGVLILFGGGMFFLGMKSVETVKQKPVVIELPAITGKTEVIQLEPKTREVFIGATQKVKVDSTYYYKYLTEVHEKNKLQMYIDPITIREKTVTVVDDSIVKISVTSKTRGTLLSQYAEYTIKERHAIVQPEDLIIPKLKVFVGGVLSMPIDVQNINQPSVGANVILERTENEDLFTLGINTDKVVSVGYSFRIFKGKK